MNPNVWNIKEILSIPTGNSGAKIPNRTGVTNGHASLTDSQFVCGSQFWPENSQGMSQEMSFSSRTSQQSSQEGRDKAVQNVQKAIGILDKFEEDKKKAKEKSESDLLAKECLHFRETLNNMKHSVIDTEKNTAVCKTILEGFDKFATTLQQNLSSLHNDIVQQFEVMLNKVNSQTRVLTEMEERVLKTGGASTEMSTHVQGLQKNLEALREEQGREQNMLQEALNLLSTLVHKHSTQPDPIRVTDSAIQTSPGLVQPLSKISQPQHSQVTLCQPQHSQVTLCQPEHSQVTLCQPEHSQVTLCQPGHSQLAVPCSDHWESCITAESRAALRGRKRNRRRPLVPPRRSKGSIWNENTQPQTKNLKQEVAKPLKQLRSSNQMVSPKSDPRIGYNMESRSNKSTVDRVTPFSMWSQDSTSSVCIAGIEPSSERLPTGPKIQITENTKGFWQLFDISCDSDPYPVEEE